MARQNYFELIQNTEFDAEKEFDIISKFISEKENYSNILAHPNTFSLRQFFNINFTSYLYQRSIQFTSYDEVEKYLKEKLDGLDSLFTYIEFIVDLYSFLSKRRNPSDLIIYPTTSLESMYIMVKKRINYSLNATNHELLELANGHQIIVEKNVYASEVSQIVSETNIQEAMKVLEYNHFANKGNIQRKQEILTSLAKHLEPLRAELNSSEELKEVLKVNNKKIIAVEKLFEMFNQFGLRHNNNKQYHADLTDEELEQWYDDIYTSTLFVILSLDEARILPKLAQARVDWAEQKKQIE